MKIDLDHDHGLIVWGKLTRKEDAWAAMIISTKKLDLIFEEKESYSWVWWFNHNTFSHVRILLTQLHNQIMYSSFATGQRGRGIEDAVKILLIRFGVEVPSYLFEKCNTLLPWANNHFEEITKDKIGKFRRGEEYFIPRDIIDKIRCLNGKNIKLTIEKNLENNFIHPRRNKKNTKIQHSSKIEYRYCLSCRIASQDLTYNHPLFHGSLCKICFERVKDLLMPIASDSSNPVCCVCVSLEHDELVLCDVCIRSYCTVCLNIYCGQGGLKEILRKSPWSCFACNEYPNSIISGLVRRTNFEQLQNVYELYPVIKKNKIRINPIEISILVLKHNSDIISKVLELLKWQCKVFNYCLNDGKDCTCNIQDDLHITTSDLLEKKSSFNILMKYYPNISDENDLKKFDENGVLEEFFDFIRIKNIIENTHHKNENSLIWVFETSASITYLEQKIITRFCNNTRPTLVGMHVHDVRHRSRFIWTNLYLQNIEKYQDVNLFPKKDMFYKTSNDCGYSDLWCCNSIHVVLKSIKKLSN
ncbi:DNA (cytosine-5)-methyltransferase 3B-like isoform X2 [Daktulosphaira vitifoliae]|uniref:DNA (cytosine-5)-methyltransferase 3B-like isoform X2 n=1 Tax=Daktulosphaira vitifoliae TaxID=58002 RepID=UPI0021AA32FC|nr:DNA (cytosine-5)-methyltransferase 3B-like isoform X2 [Daktulosphaira vitifoliae]